MLRKPLGVGGGCISKRRKATDTALPVYASVVEFGKLRLHNCLNFLRRTTRPEALRIFYSQVDNLVLGMSSENLEDLVDERRRPEFEEKKSEFFGDAAGKPVEKWKVTTMSGGDSPDDCGSGSRSKER